MFVEQNSFWPPKFWDLGFSARRKLKGLRLLRDEDSKRRAWITLHEGTKRRAILPLRDGMYTIRRAKHILAAKILGFRV